MRPVSRERSQPHFPYNYDGVRLVLKEWSQSHVFYTIMRLRDSFLGNGLNLIFHTV